MIRLGICFIESAKKMYGWELISIKIGKECATGNLFQLKRQSKAWLWIYVIKNTEKRYS